MEKPKNSDAEDALARSVVRDGVAKDVALGWAARNKSAFPPRSATLVRDVRTLDVWELGAGRAHRSGDSISDAPIFDLASLTKPMTAMAIAIACKTRMGGLDRDAPLASFLDEARGTSVEDAPLELLLAHRAGLEAHLDLYAPLVRGQDVDRSAALRAAANARRAEVVGSGSPREGHAPLYSDLGYLLAGEALARALGARDAGEAIEELVVRPLGLLGELGTARSLRAASVDFDKRVCPTEVVAWRGGEVRGAVHDENAWALSKDGGSGHAGMFGTLNAVLLFGCSACDAIASNEDLGWLVRERPGGSLRAGFDGKSPEGSSAGERAGPRTYGHLGFTGTSFWIDPDAEALVVLLTNRVHPTRENVAIRAVRPKIHDALFALARGLP